MRPPTLSRKEARAERANLKKVEEDANKVRLLARLAAEIPQEPRTAHAPIKSNQQPRVAVDPSDIFKMKMTWCVTIKDVDGAWSWGQPRQWTQSEFTSHIKSTLDALTRSTWREIHQMFSGGLQRHHEQNVTSIASEAQDRWAHLGIDTDTAFRFRLTGRQRAWGVREGSHFKMVWYDKEHKIYVVEKSNT